MLQCTLGIMAYNEEKNIGQLLAALLRQKLIEVKIEKIIVVASGCTDQTVKIVQTFTQKYPQLELITEPERKGKSAAINLFLKRVKTPIVILESADTLPLFYTIETLVTPFQNPKIGMCGARPLPQNNPNTFMGFTNHLLWTLHHLLSLERPKMGELVAFRNIVPAIPETSAVDETSIEAYLHQKGLKIKYVPEAIILNYGAENIKDFLKQRRRIYTGHSVIRRQEKYRVATLNGFKIFWLILKNIKIDFKTFFWLIGAILLEMYGRLLGFYDSFIKNKTHAVWEVAESTKDLKVNDN